MAVDTILQALRLTWAYFRLNLAAAMEYRMSFVAQCLGMAANDAIMFSFWWFYFDRFPQLAGWTMVDLLLVWGFVATSIGLAVVVFGNSYRLATLVVQGQLDYYLSLPRDPLLHALVSRTSLAGWGDVAFGLLAFAVAVGQGAPPIGLAILLTLTSVAIAVGFTTLLGSLAFFIGNAEAAALQGRDALITFSLYPGSIFHGGTKFVLMVLIPAGFISHIPVELVREFDWARLLLVLGFTVALWALALTVFRLGLRRYESGNLIAMRS